MVTIAPTIFPDFTLSSGRTVTHALARNGGQLARISDGNEMTEAEWPEYVERLKSWNAARIKKGRQP